MKHPAKSILLVLLLLGTVACGASQREKAIKASFITLKAAHAGFVEWDKTRQDKIIEQATSLEEGQAKLKAYREKQTQIYAGIAKAMQLLLDVMTDDRKNLSDAVRESAETVKSINTFKDQP